MFSVTHRPPECVTLLRRRNCPIPNAFRQSPQSLWAPSSGSGATSLGGNVELWGTYSAASRLYRCQSASCSFPRITSRVFSKPLVAIMGSKRAWLIAGVPRAYYFLSGETQTSGVSVSDALKRPSSSRTSGSDLKSSLTLL